MDINTYTVERDDNIIAYVEGVYYKYNNAIIYNIQKKRVYQRNTWTGEEITLKENINKSKAMKYMRDYIRKGYERI